MEYELLFFTSVANEERAPEIKREIEEIVAGQGGKISTDFSDIGKRKFAHPIKKQTHGFFSFCRFTLEEKDNIPEIERRLRLNDKIMRHIIVRADEIGKPIGGQAVRDERMDDKKSNRNFSHSNQKAIAEKIATTEEAKKAKPTAKVEMAELDEKINEILDETPE